MRILAFLTDPPVVSAILLHLDLPHLPPPLSPARGPPQGDFLLDQTSAFAAQPPILLAHPTIKPPSALSPYPVPRLRYLPHRFSHTQESFARYFLILSLLRSFAKFGSFIGILSSYLSRLNLCSVRHDKNKRVIKLSLSGSCV